MDIGSIFLILAILIPVVLFISRPLMNGMYQSTNNKGQDISALLAEKDQVIAQLQELDDDNNLGKIPPDIYPAQRAVLLQHGADILRHIDAYQSAPVTGAAEDRLETALASRRLAVNNAQQMARKNGNAVPPVPDDSLEQKIATRRRLKEGKAGGFCPKCGKPVQENDRFCPRCGANLA